MKFELNFFFWKSAKKSWQPNFSKKKICVPKFYIFIFVDFFLWSNSKYHCFKWFEQSHMSLFWEFPKDTNGLSTLKHLQNDHIWWISNKIDYSKSWRFPLLGLTISDSHPWFLSHCIALEIYTNSDYPIVSSYFY